MNTNKTMFPGTAEETLKRLMEGNRRFVEGVRSIEPLSSHLRMNDLAKNGQKPFVIVLTCSDSRSPVEMIFDQGVGDVFVVRVAGNVVAPSLLASIEFAAVNFGSPLILVMGHTQCGAVNATISLCQKPGEKAPSVNLEELVSRIRPSVEKIRARESCLSPDRLLVKCTDENVRHSMRQIVEQSPLIRELVSLGRVEIRGAVLDIGSGRVSPMVTAEDESRKDLINPAVALA
jgi:carbonic anhydrase